MEWWILDGWWRIEWTDGLIDRLGEIKTIVCQFSFIHWIRVCHACSRTTVNCRLPAKLAAMRSSAVFTERLSWMWSGGLLDHSCECHHYVPSGSLSLPPSLSCSASALVRMFRRQRLGPSLLLFTYHAQKKKENIKNFSAHQTPGTAAIVTSKPEQFIFSFTKAKFSHRDERGLTVQGPSCAYLQAPS